MIWRLEYENAHGDVARLDIQRDAATPVEIIEGTENPFLLSYELEGKNKKGFIMSSFADISVYETPTFNIDDLKTSNETELSVKWYINSALTWSGFVVPDFFSREIGEPAIVNLAASDRLSSLKNATLDGLSEYVKLKDLAIACLAKTGLSLPLISTVDFKVNTTNVMDVFALSDRLEDDKGKKISCYDILRSILVLSNSTIRQRNGHWTLINKIQHEAISPQLTFNEVYAGAKRTIQPVFSSVGAFQEFGGLKSSPANNSFNAGVTGWTAVNGFAVEFDTREISYSLGSPVIIFRDETDDNKLINRNVIISQQGFYHAPRLFSSDIRIPFANGKANFDVIISSRGTELLQGIFYIEKKYVGKPSQFTSDGKQWSYAPGEIKSQYKVNTPFSDSIVELNCTLPLEEGEDPSEISIVVHIGEVWALAYDAGEEPIGTGIAINSVRLISKTKNDAKGMLYRTEQIGVFSKKNDPETTIFADYISSGLNGYFYPYSEDDNSILRIQANDDYLTSRWTTATDPDSGELPILQHVARQNSRMFGVAHNILSAVIDANTFNPLSNVSNCAGEKYVIVAATFDFLRSTVEVELQQIAYGTLERRDFIYNYFGGEDDGIRSIGAASSGGGTSIGGGGSFLDKYFSFDEANDALVANVSLVSEKEIAAYFADGSIPSIFDSIPFATSAKVGGIKASSTYQNGIRINSSGFLEIDPSYADSGVSSWNDLTNRPTWLTPTTKALFEEAHDHTWGQITGLGTAATRDAQTSLTDTTTGRLMEVGAFGLGGNGENNADLNDTSYILNQRTSFSTYTATSLNKPTGANYGTILNIQRNPNEHIQIISDLENNELWFRTRYTSTPNVWKTMNKLYHTGNLINPVTGTGTAGQISYWNGTGSQAGSDNLVWDNANTILSVSSSNSVAGLWMAGSNIGIRQNNYETNGVIWKNFGYTKFSAAILPIDTSSYAKQGIGFYTGDNNDTTTDASLRLSILRNGNVLIGTSTDSGYKLDVNGAIRAAGNIYATGNITSAGEVTAYTASDKRLKTNINKFGNALSIIDKLTPVTYNWNAKAVELNGNKDMTGVNYGLIAQELEQIVPDLIRPIYGDYKTYDDRGLMTIMLQAIKELKAEVDLLKNKN